MNIEGKDASAHQETFAGLPQYRFPAGVTIWTKFYGRCELLERLVGERYPDLEKGLHIFRALKNVKVFSFRENIHGERILSTGKLFTAYSSNGTKLK